MDEIVVCLKIGWSGWMGYLISWTGSFFFPILERRSSYGKVQWESVRMDGVQWMKIPCWTRPKCKLQSLCPKEPTTISPPLPLGMMYGRWTRNTFFHWGSSSLANLMVVVSSVAFFFPYLPTTHKQAVSR
jgi:hypothetical protein